MQFGKTIELFLVNGEADGYMTGELSNWNGKAIKIPRVDIEKIDVDDLGANAPGVYFLLCNENDENSVYIGESEDVHNRLKQHIQDYKAGKEKYYWHSAVILLGRDLDKALIRYLENRFVEITNKNGKYKIITKNTYKNTVLKRSQIASMEEFIENSRILITVFGYKFLETVPQATNDDEYFYCKRGDSEAKAFLSNEGITVVAGSKIVNDLNPSAPNNVKTARQKLIDSKIIVNNEFVENYEFASPSLAAGVIFGGSANGRTEWTKKDGTSLKDFQNKD